MLRHLCLALLGASSLPLSVAQAPGYFQTTVTQCFSIDAATPLPTTWIPPAGPTVTVNVPGCGSCDCNTCTHTVSQTTQFEAFCPTGLVDLPYTILQVHKGMSMVPDVPPAPTGPPLGFTQQVGSCDHCGSATIEKMITFPIDGSPHATIAPELLDLLQPSEMPVPSDEDQGRHDTPSGSTSTEGSSEGSSEGALGDDSDQGMNDSSSHTPDGHDESTHAPHTQNTTVVEEDDGGLSQTGSSEDVDTLPTAGSPSRSASLLNRLLVALPLAVLV